MDVDATLINEETIDLLGALAGVGDDMAAITARTMAGELDFAQSLRRRVALLEGLDASALDKAFHSSHFTTGAFELIDALHRCGWKVGAVSGGFHETVDRLASAAHLDHWLANRLEAHNATLTGKLAGSIVTKDTKADALRIWAASDGISLDHTVAVGDGANDIPMLEQAALGIAFCAKPAVRQRADACIDTRDLRLVLDLLKD
jgi:phosphoserine phosphatase